MKIFYLDDAFEVKFLTGMSQMYSMQNKKMGVNLISFFCLYPAPPLIFFYCRLSDAYNTLLYLSLLDDIFKMTLRAFQMWCDINYFSICCGENEVYAKRHKMHNTLKHIVVHTSVFSHFLSFAYIMAFQCLLDEIKFSRSWQVSFKIKVFFTKMTVCNIGALMTIMQVVCSKICIILDNWLMFTILFVHDWRGHFNFKWGF